MASVSSNVSAESRITLRPPTGPLDQLPSGWSSALALRLDDSVLADVRAASDEKKRLQFVTGSAPKLHIGTRSIDLTLSSDAFRSELYASTTAASTADLTFRTLLSHRAESKSATAKAADDTAGSDAALAALQNSLASYAQEKQANQTNITKTVMSVPKNRYDAARQEKQERRRGLQGSGRNVQQGGGPARVAAGSQLSGSSAANPLNEDEARLKAMRTPIIHLLAGNPASVESIRSKTHVPQAELDAILPKIGKLVDGKWQLLDRAYKDLDVWKFRYPSSDARQAAIDNAVRAYDRLRLGKDDKLWQMLLPSAERDKGTVLSRLHLGAGHVNRVSTPLHQASPAVHGDGVSDSKAPSLATTPRLGPSTPRTTNSTTDIKKRLLSKNPQKARAAEEAKEMKRKAIADEKEKARPAKRQATGRAESKFKSEEFVHSSDDESDEAGEIHVATVAPPRKVNEKATKAATNAKPQAASSSSDSSDVPIQALKEAAKLKAKSGGTTAAATERKSTGSSAIATAKSVPGKATPKTTSGLSAPSSQHKHHQRSPSNSKTDSRPTVPSPLGAARPRVPSDVSDRAAIGVQKARQGGDTPKGLGITNGARKRHDTVTSNGGTDSPFLGNSSKKLKGPTKKEINAAAAKPATNGANGTARSSLANGGTAKPSQHETHGVKRKADTSPGDRTRDGGAPAAKHRKTDSLSSQSQKSLSSSNGGATATVNGTAHTSPDAALFSSSTPSATDVHTTISSSTADVLSTITYAQGVIQAEQFQKKYYPVYVELYDKIEAKSARGETVSTAERERLWKMHNRLKNMKAEIEMASKREGME